MDIPTTDEWCVRSLTEAENRQSVNDSAEERQRGSLFFHNIL